jgi:hypothetical protein
MSFVYVGVYQYQCTYCQRTNLRRMTISAESLEDANQTVRSQVLPCGFCLRKLTVETGVTIEVRRALPGEGAETAGELSKNAKKSSSA